MLRNSQREGALQETALENRTAVVQHHCDRLVLVCAEPRSVLLHRRVTRRTESRWINDHNHVTAAGFR